MPGQPDDEIKKGSAAMAGLMGGLLGGGAGGGDLSSDDDSMPGIEAPDARPAAAAGDSDDDSMPGIGARPAAAAGDSDDDSMPGIEAPDAPAAAAGGDSDEESMPGLEPGAAAPPAAAGDGLDGMSVKQLKAEMARSAAPPAPAGAYVASDGSGSDSESMPGLESGDDAAAAAPTTMPGLAPEDNAAAASAADRAAAAPLGRYRVVVRGKHLHLKPENLAAADESGFYDDDISSSSDDDDMPGLEADAPPPRRRRRGLASSDSDSEDMPAMEEEDMEAAYETAAREAGERGPKKATSFLDDISSDGGDDDDDREQTDRYKAALKKREKAAKLKAEKEARERERRAREADATAARRAVDASAERTRATRCDAGSAATYKMACWQNAVRPTLAAGDGYRCEGLEGFDGVMLKTLEKWTRGDAWHGEGKLDKRVEKCKRPPSVAKPKPSKKASKKGGPRAPAKAPAAKPRTESIADDATSSVWVGPCRRPSTTSTPSSGRAQGDDARTASSSRRPCPRRPSTPGFATRVFMDSSRPVSTRLRADLRARQVRHRDGRDHRARPRRRPQGRGAAPGGRGGGRWPRRAAEAAAAAAALAALGLLEDVAAAPEATSPEAEGRKVLVLGLASTAAEDDLFDYFATFGTVEAVDVAADLNTGATVGYVTMATWQEAAAILDRGAVVGGVSLEVVLARPRELEPTPRGAPPPDAALLEGRKLFVGGLSPATDEDALCAYFGSLGSLAEASVARRGGASRGFGFVTFATRGDADAALAAGHVVDSARVELSVDGADKLRAEGVDESCLGLLELGDLVDIGLGERDASSARPRRARRAAPAPPPAPPPRSTLPPWCCATCTLENDPDFLMCSACGSPPPPERLRLM
ncbi:hypothetical protein JL720_14979 [Aureococcus anophagefferens]|nr:hypothetical protein JL720_14979 [Aureococcus anophagefferens]